MYIIHRKYQVKPHSSLWFTPDYSAAMLIEIATFIFINNLEHLNLRPNSDRLVIVARWFWSSPNIHMLRRLKNLSFLKT